MGHGICELCGGAFVRVDTRTIRDTHYFILKCQSCHHVIARNAS